MSTYPQHLRIHRSIARAQSLRPSAAAEIKHIGNFPAEASLDADYAIRVLVAVRALDRRQRRCRGRRPNAVDAEGKRRVTLQKSIDIFEISETPLPGSQDRHNGINDARGRQREAVEQATLETHRGMWRKRSRNDTHGARRKRRFAHAKANFIRRTVGRTTSGVVPPQQRSEHYFSAFMIAART